MTNQNNFRKLLEGKAEKLSRAFGYMTQEEVRTLKAVVSGLPENAVIVNIGAGAGTSALAILEERPDLRSTTWTIDISRGGVDGGLQNEINAFASAKMAGPNQILDDSRHAAGAWDKGPIDLIFIDDGHLEDEIRGDIVGWLPHVKPGGFIVFHDYGSLFWPGVKKVVDELLGYEETYEYIDYLLVKKTRPE